MNDEITENTDAIDARARRAARKIGLYATKSRRQLSLDNAGGFMIIEPNRNLCYAGSRFELSAEDVIQWCEEPLERITGECEQ